MEINKLILGQLSPGAVFLIPIKLYSGIYIYIYTHLLSISLSLQNATIVVFEILFGGRHPVGRYNSKNTINHSFEV